MADEVAQILDGYARRVATYNMKQLDILGRGMNVPRRWGEADAEYRIRLLTEAERGLRESLARASRAVEDYRTANHGLSLAEGLEDPSTVTPEGASQPTARQAMDQRLAESALDRIDRMFGQRCKL